MAFEIKWEFNPIYYQKFLFDESRRFVLGGGANSGKSHAVAQKLIFRCINEGNHRFLVVRKVRRSHKVSTFQLIKDKLIQLHIDFKENKQDLTIEFLNNKFIFEGLDKPEFRKGIEGITGIWIEEATEITSWEFDLIDQRLRGEREHYKQTILTFNPDLIFGEWIYKKWFEGKELGIVREHIRKHYIFNFTMLTTIDDNNFAPIDDYLILDSLKDRDPEKYEIYRLGKWALPKELIFSNYEIKNIEINRFDQYIAGIDWGFVNPCVFLLIGVYDKEFYIIDEIYQSQLLTSDFINLINEKILQIKLDKSQILCYADNAEPDRIQQFRLAGFNMQDMTKGKTNHYRIQKCKEYKFYIDENCVNAKREIIGYTWEKKKDKVTENPLKLHDHCCDAFTYAVYNYTLNWGGLIQQEKKNIKSYGFVNYKRIDR